MYPLTGVTHLAQKGWRVAAGILAVLGWYGARHLRRVSVTGESMLPTLQPGDRVLALRAGRLLVGDIVACVDPRDPGRILVKRVAAVATGGGYVVLGDNTDTSTDSRHFGPISSDLIIGRLIFRYMPERRAGVISRRSARFAFETGDGHARCVDEWR